MTRLGFLLGVALGLTATAASARSVLYVGNSTGDDVAVIDVATQKLVTSIKLGQTVHGVCAPADGRKIYATIESDHTVRVVDTATNQQIDSIPLPGQPNECAITADGHYIVVPLLAPANSAVIIDTGTKQIVKTLPLKHPHNCFAPEGGSNDAIWCEERDMWRINRIDMKTMQYTDYVNVGGDPRPFIVSADEKTLFTALSGLHGFATIDLVKKTESEVALPAMALMNCKIEPANTPTHGIERTTDRKKIWITSVADSGIYIYDFAAKKLSTKVAVGACPNWISMSKDGKYAAVSNADDDNISILDAHTAKELARIKTGNAPKRLLVVEVPDRKSASAAPN
jgi:YVTN family beta-propeller protein